MSSNPWRRVKNCNGRQSPLVTCGPCRTEVSVREGNMLRGEGYCAKCEQQGRSGGWEVSQLSRRWYLKDPQVPCDWRENMFCFVFLFVCFYPNPGSLWSPEFHPSPLPPGPSLLPSNAALALLHSDPVAFIVPPLLVKGKIMPWTELSFFNKMLLALHVLHVIWNF